MILHLIGLSLFVYIGKTWIHCYLFDFRVCGKDLHFSHLFYGLLNVWAEVSVECHFCVFNFIGLTMWETCTNICSLYTPKAIYITFHPLTKHTLFKLSSKFIFQIRGLKLICHEGLYEKRRQSRHAKRIAISWWFSSESATDVAECLEYLQSHTIAQHQTNMQLRALVQDSNIQFKKVRDQLSFDE